MICFTSRPLENLYVAEPWRHEDKSNARHGGDLVLVDGVPHPRVDALVHRRPHAAEHLGRLLHPRQRNVRVDVAAARGTPAPRRASPDSRAACRAARSARRSGRRPPRNAAGDARRTPATGRRPARNRAARSASCGILLRDQSRRPARRARRRPEVIPGSLSVNRREKRVRIPGAAGRLRREERDVGGAELGGERRACPPPTRRARAP